MTTFRKRTFTLPQLGESLAMAGLHLPVLVASLARSSLTPALREQVMLAVTSVNDCRYCDWVHTGLALENGVDLAELAGLLDQSLDSLDDNTAVAILFGKHFADSQRRPSRAARDKLRDHFSPWQRRQIMAWIHAIYFANLTGNSADATLARLKGRQVDGNPFTQALAGALGAPVLGLIWWSSRRGNREALSGL